jgi:predicted PurR-regulated permease PerM
MDIFPISSLILALIGAVFFGICYNIFVLWLNRRGASEGYTAFLVAIGTAITLLFALPFIGLANTIILTLFFSATGIPMIIGNVREYIQRRAHGLQITAELDQDE